MKVYVASSWRNPQQPAVVEALRKEGFEVYDFRHPAPGNDGFAWRTIDPNWQQWTTEQYTKALNHPLAVDGFGLDMNALAACDFCVLILPCGRSAHLELGYAVGAGKATFVLLVEGQEPELMYKMCGSLCASLEELVEAVCEERDEHGRAG